ncbi:chloride channel protein [Coriobacteriia bacterium Es71-Z0120]|uniref:chloride channel protein n=1 Tax=Parvivirga hydrogeniphila TaxID=2939460 RepID=UPI00226103FD|nr:chloride channel protein [Parvivirga hydrogeniphila]MCL4078445.1 chloride channel protein [Parvivirga hydrogeniphila]
MQLPSRSANRHIRVLPASIIVGLIVGLAVTELRYLTTDVMWPRLISTHNPVVLFAAPAVGILLSGLLLRCFADRPEIHDAESYLEAYHHGMTETRLGSFVAKVAAAVATVGLGGAAGLEGPSLYVGSSLGAVVADRMQRIGLSRRRLRALLVAGAAAGISAVFKAPLTGLIFALEMPYTDDFAHDALIPSMLASVASYLVAISLIGTEPLFQVDRTYVPSVGNVMLALALGIVVGLAARLFLASLRLADALTERWRIPLVARAAIGGILCASFGLASFRIYGSPLAIGSGYQLIDAAAAGRYIGFASVVLFILRGGAVVSTLGSGAAGGSFVPLVSLGAIAGGAFEALAPATGPLFPIVGMAAFLSAASATPVAGAVFVAESTGAAGFVIPGLVAAAAAYVVTGGRTLSEHQRPSRRR